jgi:hypothetical protein
MKWKRFDMHMHGPLSAKFLTGKRGNEEIKKYRKERETKDE